MKGRIEVQKFLDKIMKERGELAHDLHLTRMCGGLVAVSDGKVIRARNTDMKYCPLSGSLYDCMKKFETVSLELKKRGIAEVILKLSLR